ncbi:MAG: hypothetical protein AMXMBFR7_48470 [Planctomycetota bacterium]
MLPGAGEGWALAEKIRPGKSFAYAATMISADRNLAKEDLGRALKLKLKSVLSLISDRIFRPYFTQFPLQFAFRPIV